MNQTLGFDSRGLMADAYSWIASIRKSLLASVSQPLKGFGAPEIKIVGKPLIFRSKLKFLATNDENFIFLEEHFKTAQGAIVVLGAVLGNHYCKH